MAIYFKKAKMTINVKSKNSNYDNKFQKSKKAMMGNKFQKQKY